MPRVAVRNRVRKARKPYDYSDNWCREASDYLEQRSEKTASGCWQWKLALNCNGYGLATFRGRTTSPHILACELGLRGPVPVGSEAGHDGGCQRTCCCPDHIHPRTKEENNFDDKIRDGTIQRGERSARSKISETTARQILASKGDGSQKARAKIFGTTKAVVKSIDRGVTWAWLQDPTRKAKRSRIIDVKTYDKVALLAKLRAKSTLTEAPACAKELDNNCWSWGSTLDAAGYGRIGVGGKYYFTHALALYIKSGKFATESGLSVRHLCGNKRCCNPAHIEPGTRQEQEADKIVHGTRRQGDNNKKSKLSSEQVLDIRRRWMNWETIKSLSESFGVSSSAIGDVVSRRNWAHLTEEPLIDGGRVYKAIVLTDEKVRVIRSFVQSNPTFTQKKVAAHFDVAKNTVQRLLAGKCYADVV